MTTRAQLLQALKSHAWCLEFVMVSLDELEAGNTLPGPHICNYRTSIDTLIQLLYAARRVDLTPTEAPPTLRTGEEKP